MARFPKDVSTPLLVKPNMPGFLTIQAKGSGNRLGEHNVTRGNRDFDSLGAATCDFLTMTSNACRPSTFYRSVYPVTLLDSGM